MSRFPIIPEEFELNKNGRAINEYGKRVYISYNTGLVLNNKLPQKIKRKNNIFEHPQSKYSYMIIKNTNKKGIEIERFVKVNKEKKPMKDGDNYIYLNKETGIPITGNGKKYKINNKTSELYNTLTSYILEENNNNFSGLPQRMKRLSILPNNKKQNSQQAPAGMMRATQILPPGGFIGNRKPISNVFVPKGSNNLSYSGSMFTSGPAPSSNLVHTVNAKNVLKKKTFKPGFFEKK